MLEKQQKMTNGVSNTTGKYLHCIIKGKVPKDRFKLTGLEGNAAYVVTQGNLSCLVSNTSCDHYPLWREHIIAHQKPIEEVMKHYDVLPFSFSNIANTEDQIMKILKERKDEFEELLQKFKGKTEVGLKAFWPNMQLIFQEIAKNSELQRLKKRSSALTYQQKIAAGEFVEKLLEKRKKEEAQNIIKAVSDLAEDLKEQQLFGENMILNAAFLIKKGREDEFSRRVGILAQSFPNTKLSCSGPFPLYNFISLEIKLS
ncbi:MAG: GvpL/GvpF family gas vesicle protein [Candidatus Azambacteria bacterium]|nr:GvpL/GvpF family gas vesicle protein [Candidatus Azambacteria bacterium]